MWLTCPISWPIAWILDKVAGPQEERGIFTHKQLDILVKFHERSEKNGGLIGPDAGRIMRGALKLDGRKVGGGSFEAVLKHERKKDDIEKGQLCNNEKDRENDCNTLIPWSQVKTIHIEEVVNTEFIRKVKSWAYSRIPVIGPADSDNQQHKVQGEWSGQKIFGFLHIKVCFHLMGILGLLIDIESGRA
jgi:metal transporter CNNM